MKKNILIVLLALIIAGESAWIYIDKKSAKADNSTVRELTQEPIENKESENKQISDDSFEKEYSTAAMNRSSYDKMDSYFDKIDKYMNLLKENLEESDYEVIQKAQEDWKEFQKSEFEAKGLIFDKQGTMYQNIAAGEKTELVKQRAQELKSLYEILVEE